MTSTKFAGDVSRYHAGVMIFCYDEHKKTVVHKYVHNLTVACQAMLKNPH